MKLSSYLHWVPTGKYIFDIQNVDQRGGGECSAAQRASTQHPHPYEIHFMKAKFIL